MCVFLNLESNFKIRIGGLILTIEARWAVLLLELTGFLFGFNIINMNITPIMAVAMPFFFVLVVWAFIVLFFFLKFNYGNCFVLFRWWLIRFK